MENIQKLKKAHEQYLLDDRYDLQTIILKYVIERIEANKDEINKLISVYKEDIIYEEIIELFEQAVKQENVNTEYKAYQNMQINEASFLSLEIKMPIGIIAVEAFDTKTVISYYVKAITTRNAIAISDVEYDEYSLKSLILYIIKEAIKKLNIDENIIMLLPYEECYYQYFDETIYTYGPEGKLLEKEKIEKKSYSDKKYVYVEDEKLRNEAKQNEDVEILTGNIEEVLAKIEYSYATTIYTQNTKNAYEYINKAKSMNVFVNTNVINAVKIEPKEDKFYTLRKIIIPIPKEEIIKEEMAIKVINKEQGILEKIKELLRKLFN